MQQVISISKDGVLSGLQHKPGKGLDLRTFGAAQIERASDILWDATIQRWTISVLQFKVLGPLTACRSMLDKAVGEFAAEFLMSQPGRGFHPLTRNIADDVLTFEDYDDAVKVEIALLDGYRLQGLLPPE